MILSRLLKVIALSLASLFIYACSHPIEIVGQGDVTSASGNRNCYLEDFQQAKVNCTKNYAVGAYQETYYAVPRPGWQFDRWVNYCANATPPNYDCSFNTPAAAVAQFWGQTMPPLEAVFTACSPGAPGCGWKAGEMRTFTQTSWGDGTSAGGTLLSSSFDPAYPNDLRAGGAFTLTLTGASAVFALLPALSTAGPLTAHTVDPMTTSAGELAGEVVALKLNADLSQLLGNEVDFGSLRICNFTSLPSLNGQTIDQFLLTANHILGGGSAAFGTSAAAGIARIFNNAFVNGAPSTFAQTGLVAGNCP